jgi:hypothetical protein
MKGSPMARRAVVGGWLIVMSLAAAAPAHGASSQGTAGFGIPDRHGVAHASARAHTVFALPAGSWQQAYGEQAGTPSLGRYWRTAIVHGRRCQLTLEVTSRAQRRPPRLPSAARVHGVGRALRWAVTRTGTSLEPGRLAVAYERTPSGMAPASEAWTAFTVILGANVVDAGPACKRLLSRTALRATIRSMRVAPGAPPTKEALSPGRVVSCHQQVAQAAGSLPAITVLTAEATTCRSAFAVFLAVSGWAKPFNVEDLGASEHPDTLGYRCVVHGTGDYMWALRCTRGTHIVRARAVL